MFILDNRVLIRFFVNAKAWQLILLIMGVPLLGMSWYIVSFKPTADSMSLDVSMLAASLWMNSFLIAWIWAAVAWLHSKVRSVSGVGGPTFFKIAIVFLYCLLLVFSVVIGLPFSFGDSQDMIFGVLEILLLVGLVDYFYVVAFAARTIVKAEQAISATFSKSVLTFFQIMFFPIGIWFLQPRINQQATGDGVRSHIPTIEKLIR